MSSKIRIGNLPPGCERSSLDALLTTVGDVLTLRLVMERGESIGYAEMSTVAQARDCIDHFNRQRYRGCVLSVREDVSETRAIS